MLAVPLAYFIAPAKKYKPDNMIEAISALRLFP
jgi:hypothetical protein